MITSGNKMASKSNQDVIAKKIGDLEKYGVPSLFVYATPWTGGLYVVGDKWMASIVKDSQQDFFEVLQQQPQEDMSLPELILPPLHQPIDEMNGRTLCSVLVGIAKENSRSGGQEMCLSITQRKVLTAIYIKFESEGVSISKQKYNGM